MTEPSFSMLRRLTSHRVTSYRALECLYYHSSTVVLFTLADFKTIFIPILAFACATAPLASHTRLMPACMWVWLHQFMCNVSNQARGGKEDAVNKPWRPIPSGRITESQAVVLRWVTVAMCFLCSATLGADMLSPTLGLFLTTLLYDEIGLAGHCIGKSFCNIGGYTAFEIGATKLLSGGRTLDEVSASAVSLSGALIFTTIQAQDFADVEGDRQLGRVTFPIYAPEISRLYTLIGMPTWSLVISRFWGVGPVSASVFVALGGTIGLRFYLQRNTNADKFSYVLYNIWLTAAHIFPLNARMEAFTF